MFQKRHYPSCAKRTFMVNGQIQNNHSSRKHHCELVFLERAWWPDPDVRQVCTGRRIEDSCADLRPESPLPPCWCWFSRAPHHTGPIERILCRPLLHYNSQINSSDLPSYRHPVALLPSNGWNVRLSVAPGVHMTNNSDSYTHRDSSLAVQQFCYEPWKLGLNLHIRLFITSAS